MNKVEEVFLIDQIINNMTSNQTINAALLAVGAFFVGLVPTVYASNFWYAVVAAVLGVATFVVYELLP